MRETKGEAKWPLWSWFGLDGIAAYRFRGGTYLVTANEGDPRDLADLKEDIVVKDVGLDPAAFSEDMKKPEHLGNLRGSKYDGDIDRGGDFDATAISI
jgi:hypothetical protein